MTQTSVQTQPSDDELMAFLRQHGDLDTANGIAAVRAAIASLSAPVAAQAQPAVITLSGAQLLQALDFIAPDRDTDASQLEGELSISHGDGHSGKGYYAYMSDCPDEGAVLLDGEMLEQQPVSGADELTAQWRAKLHAFMDAAAGEGLVMGGVDAADLYCAIFHGEFATAIDAAHAAQAQHKGARIS